MQAKGDFKKNYPPFIHRKRKNCTLDQLLSTIYLLLHNLTSVMFLSKLISENYKTNKY